LVTAHRRQGRASALLPLFALLAFGGLFVLLFAVCAIGEGIGKPNVPSGAVAVVEDAPAGLGTITKAKFHSALVEIAAPSPAPKPNDREYLYMEEVALRKIFDPIWIAGQAEELGISASPKEITEAIKKLKAKYKTREEYANFLKTSNLTEAWVREIAKTTLLSGRIQEVILENARQPSDSEIEDYYESAKASRYSEPELRNIRFVKSKTRGKVEEAKEKLEENDSTRSWRLVARAYSTDESKARGGVRLAVSEDSLTEPLAAAAFAAAEDKLEGPIKEGQAFAVFEVTKVTPEKVQSLDEVKSRVGKLLERRIEEQISHSFFRGYMTRWAERTFCGPGFAVVTHCGNYEYESRPAESDPACYESDPETPAVGCPAPVQQVRPAVPGSASPFTPEGQKLAQRPRL
jgi:parvulin-like peptidyl-prolyl isomerase